ncbi:hypothetical protein HLK59_35505 [Streptomyces sp. S3(2020)]|uniref:hypothetical protein n=1 Tax=Streptomyces sp. S3(2020) TaxID=2732044 RepID=UPI0014876D93|nr:hypothetical protein [Streptomyces sp. S3(2020)]NNN35580.1 hypothetical protein [Streptomyces sp. S3(2020)]
MALSAEYKAGIEAILNLSRATLSDATEARDWRDVLAHSAEPMDSGERGRLEASAQLKNSSRQRMRSRGHCFSSASPMTE